MRIIFVLSIFLFLLITGCAQVAPEANVTEHISYTNLSENQLLEKKDQLLNQTITVYGVVRSFCPDIVLNKPSQDCAYYLGSGGYSEGRVIYLRTNLTLSTEQEYTIEGVLKKQGSKYYMEIINASKNA